jgi:hypothetical protein
MEKLCNPWLASKKAKYIKKFLKRRRTMLLIPSSIQVEVAYYLSRALRSVQ